MNKNSKAIKKEEKTPVTMPKLTPHQEKRRLAEIERLKSEKQE